MEVTIYQLDIKNENAHTQMFCDFEEQQEFDFNDYEAVYAFALADKYTTDEVLESAFYIFNVQHPKNFKGHSLSVSDIVEIDGQFFYCQGIGWKDISTFCY